LRLNSFAWGEILPQRARREEKNSFLSVFHRCQSVADFFFFGKWDYPDGIAALRCAAFAMTGELLKIVIARFCLFE
jgi:hypothetical protein